MRMLQSSCLAPYLLRPHAHSTVLDMCAAPGLKTIQLAGIAQSGKVYAVERDEGRFQSLKEMIANSGADNVVTLHNDVTKLSLEKYSDVEYILLDPTCSGSGMRDRQPRSSLHSSSDKERLYKLQGFQLTLIRFAFTKFPAAKRVVYSTCSLNVEENEEVVQAALNSKHHEFQLVNVSKKLPGWKSFGSEDFEFGTECIYSRPETDLTNGFFVAVFERKKHYSRDDTRSVPENNQDYIEDMNKKVCENGSSKYKNDDTKVKYNTENDLDRENKSVRGNKNYFNYENNKSEQDTLKKRMHNSNENTDQNSGHKRFKQDVVDKNVNMPETEHSSILNMERKVYKYGSPKNKFDSTNVKCTIGSTEGGETSNISRTKSKKSNESYESGGYEQNIFKKRKESSSENNENSSHKRFKDDGHKNIKKSSSQEQFDKEDNNKMDFSVPQNRLASKVLTVSQKKRLRQRKLKISKKLVNKTKLTADDNLKTKKSKNGLIEISGKKNHEKDDSQSTCSAKIKLFSKAKLRYARMKKLKEKVNKKMNKPDATEIDSINNKTKLRKKNKNKKQIDSQDSVDGLSKSHDEDNTSKIKTHSKIKTNISEQLVDNEQATDISNSKLIKSKKSKKELPGNEALSEVSKIPNEENISKKKKHKKKYSEELAENEEKLSAVDEEAVSEISKIPNEENRSKKKKHKKKHSEEFGENEDELPAVDEALSEISNIQNEENISKKRKHKKQHSEEFAENEDELPADEALSEISNIQNEENISKKRKHKKQHSEEFAENEDELPADEVLSEVSNIQNEENRSKKKKHKKKHSEEFAENEDKLPAIDEALSEVSNIQNEENRSKKKKHKKKHSEEFAENEDSVKEKT
ncbi:putative 28S rRNA (cytosine-C(5))-methyltransferase [Homalodisca vitripennis]|nr:putative 28S rRNA (cytosine-C(5))-methyltransferase [Homalodisca vitripennis]